MKEPSVPQKMGVGLNDKPSKGEPSLVTVMGFGKNDVLFSSSKANVIQVRDTEGLVSAMLIRVKPGIWGFSKRGDEDWSQVLSIYGN